MKAGFTLIEIVLSIALGSLLAATLFMSFSQLQFSVRVADALIEVDMRSALVFNQMTRDISGAFVPQLALIETSTQKQDAQKTPVKPMPLGDVFVAKTKGDGFDKISCITNNPVALYDTVKPRIARIMYRLVADDTQQDALMLVRQESDTIELADFEKKGAHEIRSYVIAHNIKSCKISCLFLEYKEEEKDGKKEKSKKLTSRELKDWSFDAKTLKEKKMPPLPYSITLSFLFWDEQHRTEIPMEFTVPIYSFEPYIEKKKPQQEAAKKETKKPAKIAKKSGVMNFDVGGKKVTITMPKLPFNPSRTQKSPTRT